MPFFFFYSAQRLFPWFLDPIFIHFSVCCCNLQYFTLLDGQAEHFSPHKVAVVLHVLAGVGDPLERDKAEVHVHPKFDSVLQAV